MDEELQKIIQSLYEVFSCYKRPAHFTKFGHCDECREHDETMSSADLNTLKGFHLGTAGYGPLSFLTEEAFAYYMPRIIELALTGEECKYGDESVLSLLLFQLIPTKDYDRFSKYNSEQRQAIMHALEYAFSKHRVLVAEEFIQEELDEAMSYWKP